MFLREMNGFAQSISEFLFFSLSLSHCQIQRHKINSKHSAFLFFFFSLSLFPKIIVLLGMKLSRKTRKNVCTEEQHMQREQQSLFIYSSSILPFVYSSRCQFHQRSMSGFALILMVHRLQRTV